MKKYRTVILIFTAYVLMWLAIAWELWDMHKHPYDYGDGNPLSFLPTLGFFASVAHIITLIVLAVRTPVHRVLYQRLVIISALPLVVVIIIIVSEAR